MLLFLLIYSFASFLLSPKKPITQINCSLTTNNQQSVMENSATSQPLRNAREAMLAKHRKLQRQQIFRNNRQDTSKLEEKEPSYMNIFCQEARLKIGKSRTCEYEFPLPPLTTETISIYRRANQPVFVFADQQGLPNPHIINESLNLLSRLPSESYSNYLQIVNIFQTYLPELLKSVYPQILNYAILVAGNKSIGKVKQILAIADQGHEWVLINHIFDGRITPLDLVMVIQHNNSQSALRGLGIQILDPSHARQIVQLLESQESIGALEEIFKYCQNLGFREETTISCLRVLRVCFEESEKITSIAIRSGVLDSLTELLRKGKTKVKELVCGVVRGIVTHSCHCNAVLFHTRLIQKLISMLSLGSLDMKVDILDIFSQLIQKGECVQVVKLMFQQELIRTLSYIQGEQEVEIQLGLKGCVSALIDVANKQMDEQELEMFEKTMCKYGMQQLLDECITNMTLQ